MCRSLVTCVVIALVVGCSGNAPSQRTERTDEPSPSKGVSAKPPSSPVKESANLKAQYDEMEPTHFILSPAAVVSAPIKPTRGVIEISGIYQGLKTDAHGSYFDLYSSVDGKEFIRCRVDDKNRADIQALTPNSKVLVRGHGKEERWRDPAIAEFERCVPILYRPGISGIPG